MSRGTDRICIAGYMGAGKSTVAKLLADDSLPVIDADREAKRLMINDITMTERVSAAFGPSVFENGSLSFPRLGQIVFSSRDRLLQLNRIVHPPLLAHLKELVGASGSRGCILDAALATLWQIESWFSRCIWVNAEREMRLMRILAKSPDLDPLQVQTRMELQEQTVPLPASGAWTMLENNGTADELASIVKSSEYSR
jgi:dephospho-CoA kinase